MSPPTNNWK